MISAEPYRDSMRKDWDSVVAQSANSTFLHYRGFMEYHKDRFADASIMFFNKGKAFACLPANWQSDGKSIISHGGLTYGGIVRPAEASVEDVGKMLGLAMEYYKSTYKAKSLVYKPTPYIYHKTPCDEDLYCIVKNGGKLLSRAISSAVYLPQRLNFTTLRKRKCKTANKEGLSVAEYKKDFTTQTYLPEFWNILENVLRNRHNVNPVHSLDEIASLAMRFPENIVLRTVADSNRNIVGGTLLFISNNVVHAQYIAANDEGREKGALDLLFQTVIDEYSQPNGKQKYFDFGISTEKAGAYLNEGLIFQKEGFGARGVCYDSYLLEL